jgi:hypothetical protein
LFNARLATSKTDVLAGKATADYISAKWFGVKSLDVAMNWNTWPVLIQNSLAVGIPFNKLNGFKAAHNALCGIGKSTYSRKCIKKAKFHIKSKGAFAFRSAKADLGQ